MNTIHQLRIFGIALMLLTGLSVQQKVQAQPGVSMSFQTFYHELSPYGRWTNSPQYGSVWTPYVDRGFQPYSTNGYWEVTEFGNTWVSDYDWGWAPFHYGRWSYDDYNGWFWIPGYEWGPAWVNWRSGGDYYGWAPLGPGMSVNISINIPSFWWVFVPQRYIATRNWYNYCAPRNRVTHIYNQTTIINNYYRNDNRVYAYGPRRDEMERVTRSSIPVREIDRNSRGRVITDRYTPDRNDNSGRNNGTYRSNERISEGRGNNGSYRSNERISEGRGDNGSYRANERTSESRGDNGSYRNAPERGNADRSQPNPRTNSENGDRSYERSSRISTPNADVYRNENSGRGNSERNRSYPSSEQSGREYRSPSSEQGNGRSSGRQSEVRQPSPARETPAVRSAPSERSAPQSSRSNGNGGGGNQGAERSGRGPR